MTIRWRRCRTRWLRPGVPLAVIAVAVALVACESVQVDRVNAARAAAAVAELPVSESLTTAARAHSAAMCASGQVVGSPSPAVDYGPEPAVALVDLVGVAVLDPAQPDPGARNGEATTAIWSGWADEPALVQPQWDTVGVGEHECADGRLYMTLVLRDDPPLDCTASGVATHRNLAYRSVAGVDPNLVSLDLSVPVRPPGCPAVPLVVYVHGGGFASGDKANQIADKVALFTGEGWAFASVNYRLSPNPPNALPGQVRYPVHEQDVAAAIAWLGAQRVAYGLDTARTLLIGHSAGAYLATLVSVDPSFLAAAGVDPTTVRCAVSLDTEYDAATQVAQGGNQEVVYRNAFGDDPVVWAAGSPVNHVGGTTPDPSFLIVTRGTARRVSQAQAFATSLSSSGASASLLNVNPLSHEAVNDAVGASGDTVVTPPLLSFLRGCVAAPPVR